MNSKDLIKYVSSILNIDTRDNPLLVEDILEELSKLNDLGNFRIYMKENVKAKRYEFLTGFQKFNEMVKDFKSLGNEARKGQIETYCVKIVDKCRAISNTAYRDKPKGYNFDTFIDLATFNSFRVDGVPVFNDKEIELLEKVGGCKRWLVCFDEHKFLEDLIKAVYELRKSNVVAIENKGKSDTLKRLSNNIQ